MLHRVTDKPKPTDLASEDQTTRHAASGLAGVQPAIGPAYGLTDVSNGRRGFALGLSAKLLLFTVAFVMLAEILIFAPSVANFRVQWLNDRLISSHLAVLAAEATPSGTVPVKLRDELLRVSKVHSIAVKRDLQRKLILVADMPLRYDVEVDLRPSRVPTGLFAGLGHRLGLIWSALAVFMAPDDRTLKVIGEPGGNSAEFIEIMVPEAPLKAAMVQYGLHVLALSIIISIFTAALVYLTLRAMLVRPITRLTRNMLYFSHKPEDVNRIIKPSERRDEVGVAERELANMQTELSQVLYQKNRLAALGLAVSKVNHDLRNMLASAQLISDRLGTLPDPTVQRFAPKLIASLDRAITFCNQTLKFGHTQEEAPRRDLFRLIPLLQEVGDNLGLPNDEGVGWRLEIDAALRIDADREQLFRVMSNLCRNAMQALMAQAKERDTPGVDRKVGTIVIKAKRIGRMVILDVSDDGPGVPQMARQNLFKAFQGSTRKGGSGLGLAIAQELVQALGGTLELLDTTAGATFRLTIPDRSA